MESTYPCSQDTLWAMTDIGLSRCDIKGAQLWNNHLQTTSQFLYKKSVHRQVWKFRIRKYNELQMTMV